MNPYRGSEDGTTDYAAAMADTYKSKISGPILDRIDLWIEVPHVPYETLVGTRILEGETSKARHQIQGARDTQLKRLSSRGVRSNAEMSSRDIEDTIYLSQDVRELLRHSAERLNLSPRSYHRLIKVARTIADLEDSSDIAEHHVLEALQYRAKT